MTGPALEAKPASKEKSGGAVLVAGGIFLSRIMGLVRARAFTHFLGLSDPADAFNAAIRIPNILQNLFGEGVLSASFIPVYAKLLAEGDEEEAGKVAGAVFSLLAVVATVLVLVGIYTTPFLISLLTPGFQGEKRDLTIRLVQMMFPGVGLLVISSWCLGVLNSHRRFFLSYASPVAWNLVMIGALLGWGPKVPQAQLVLIVALASVVGSALQLAVQLPMLIRLERKLKVSIDPRRPNVRVVVSSFIPVFFGRGVVQISAYVDQWLASLILVSGAVSVLSYAQNISMLPISLFGMAIAASQLPAMSSALGNTQEIAEQIRARLDAGLRRIAFYIIPSAVAFVLLGDVIAAVLYQSGKFTVSSTLWVWGVLAGSAVGLLAGTMGRLYSSAFYALRDTKTPLKFAIIRVVLTLVLGYLAALRLPDWIGIAKMWGVAGLTASAGIAGWLEFFLLRRELNTRIGVTGVPLKRVGALWLAAIVGALAGLAARYTVAHPNPLVQALIVLPIFGLVYVGIAKAIHVPEADELLQRLRVVRRAS